jgi:hypothetical protein
LLGQCLLGVIFNILRRELDLLDGKHSRDSVRRGVFEYIEVYYNRKRRHSTLGYLTPEEAERKRFNVLSTKSGEVQSGRSSDKGFYKHQSVRFRKVYDLRNKY